MKKIISLVMAIVVCLLSFASCSGPTKVKVNGTKIDNEVYTYFDDMYEGDEEKTEKAISRYVTVNTEFSIRNLTLTASQKSKLAQDVDDLWHIYGAYYKEIGVSKQTFYKIKTSKAYEDALLEYYYGPNGYEPVSEDALKEYFKKNYIAISYATEYLFNFDETGALVPMTNEEKTVITDEISRAVGLINTGSLIEETTEKEVQEAIINSANDGNFPSGFYKEVSNIKVGSAGMVTLNDYVFLVERIDVFDEEYNYYDEYRTTCLRAAKGKDFEKLIDTWSQNYVVN